MEATQSTSQVVCTHCEERVHRYAARCPYCQHDLTSPVVALSEFQFDHMIAPHKEVSQVSSSGHANKIMPLAADKESGYTPQFKQASIPTQIHPQVPVQTNIEKKQLQLEPIQQENIYKVLFSLIALLTGSFFAFFGLILKLFSKNGKLVIEWNAEQWPYYFFPAFLLVVYGMLTLSPQEQETIL